MSPVKTAKSARRVLVTGASRGIGRAIAVEVARAGFEVAVNYRRGAEAAAEVCAAIESAGGAATLLPFDVADREAAEAAIAGDIEARGAFWGLVLNAGVTRDSALPMMTGEDWDQVMRTNLDGFYNVVKPAVMPMVRARDGGRIVTLSSISGRMGNPGQANYAASKAGLVAATRSVALELAKRGITANSVAPGFVDTDMLEGLPMDELVGGIPMKRMGKPEEVAAVVTFLLSEGAGYVTGECIGVSGGLG